MHRRFIKLVMAGALLAGSMTIAAPAAAAEQAKDQPDSVDSVTAIACAMSISGPVKSGSTVYGQVVIACNVPVDFIYVGANLTRNGTIFATSADLCYGKSTCGTVVSTTYRSGTYHVWGNGYVDQPLNNRVATFSSRRSACKTL